MRCRESITLCLLVGLLHGAVCAADTIEFDSGERLTGTLLRIVGGRVIFKLEIAGDISTQLTRFTFLSTNEAVEIGLDNGAVLTGSIFTCRRGRLVMQARGGPPAATPGARWPGSGIRCGAGPSGREASPPGSPAPMATRFRKAPILMKS